MTIDWTHFTPWSAAIGGALVGLGAAMMALFNGRIAGVSGILGGLLRPTREDGPWRFAFVLGLVLAPAAYLVVAQLPEIVVATPYPVLILAGFLVGIGTRYGSGCTSGHGICGVSRLSPRSLVATACFMATGFATVFIVRHLLA
jgi:uncharacterized membrane protein YedE/YeeE